MIRVFIIEDEPIMREMLDMLIARTDDLQVAGMAATGDDALTNWNDDEVDVTLLDLTLPGTPGLTVLAELRRKAPEARVVVLSGTHRLDVVPTVRKAGASGFVIKGDPQDVIRAIRSVARGEQYFEKL